MDVSDHSIPAAIKTYREERDALKKGDKKTGKRENSGLNKWVEFCNMRQEAKQPKPTHIADLDSKMLKNFAVWRRKKALAELEGKLEEGVTLDARRYGNPESRCLGGDRRVARSGTSSALGYARRGA